MNGTEYENKKPIAVLPLNNWGGLEILDIQYGIENVAIVRDQTGDITECEIHCYDTEAEDEEEASRAYYRAYIKWAGNKYYLDEFMRTDY